MSTVAGQDRAIHAFDFRVTAAIVLMVLLALYLSRSLMPDRLQTVDEIDIESQVPLYFGQWAVVNAAMGNPMLNVGGNSTDTPYDQVVYRGYRNRAGKMVLLAVAWGRNQRQEIKIHRPELCYEAQGLHVSNVMPTDFALGLDSGHGLTVPGKFLVGTAESGMPRQLVAYWIRIGGIFSESAVETRLHLIRQGLAGHIPDGVLIRASMMVDDPTEDESSRAELSQFLSDLVGAMSPGMRAIAVGQPAP